MTGIRAVPSRERAARRLPRLGSDALPERRTGRGNREGRGGWRPGRKRAAHGNSNAQGSCIGRSCIGRSKPQNRAPCAGKRANGGKKKGGLQQSPSLGLAADPLAIPTQAQSSKGSCREAWRRPRGLRNAVRSGRLPRTLTFRALRHLSLPPVPPHFLFHFPPHSASLTAAPPPPPPSPDGSRRSRHARRDRHSLPPSSPLLLESDPALPQTAPRPHTAHRKTWRSSRGRGRVASERGARLSTLRPAGGGGTREEAHRRWRPAAGRRGSGIPPRAPRWPPPPCSGRRLHRLGCRHERLDVASPGRPFGRRVAPARRPDPAAAARRHLRAVARGSHGKIRVAGRERREGAPSRIFAVPARLDGSFGHCVPCPRLVPRSVASRPRAASRRVPAGRAPPRPSRPFC